MNDDNFDLYEIQDDYPLKCISCGKGILKGKLCEDCYYDIKKEDGH